MIPDAKSIKCPYYITYTDTQIVCEGMDARSRFLFRAAKGLTPEEQAAAAREHRRRFCNRDWRRCPIARGQNQRYEEELP